MDSWDDDEFEVPTVTENQIQASWDDEEEQESNHEPVVDQKTKGPLKPKQVKKMKIKEIEQKQKLEIALTKARLAAQAEETDEQRRSREKASIEDADFDMAVDAFAGAPPKEVSSDATKGEVANVISTMRLLSLADHELLGEEVASRLVTSNSKHALECIKVILTKASVHLTADDMKEITTIINVIKNEKIAAAKPKSKKKKQTGKQGYANVERGLGSGSTSGKALQYDEMYDDYDDYDDFM